MASESVMALKYLLIAARFGNIHSSLVAQLVKNTPAVQEIPVRFLGWDRLPTPVFWPGEFHGLYRVLQRVRH